MLNIPQNVESVRDQDKASRSELIRQIAKGSDHDFNNHLCVLMMNLPVIDQFEDLSASMKECLQEALQMADLT
ncbi:MAG: hypothetical protein AAGA18_07850 [Verrucomicrobiota bacterium]